MLAIVKLEIDGISHLGDFVSERSRGMMRCKFDELLVDGGSSLGVVMYDGLIECSRESYRINSWMPCKASVFDRNNSIA